jgi:hypothetical protein
MSDVRRLAAATLVAALSLVGISSCQGGDEKPGASPTRSEASTPLESLSTVGLVVQRDAFCSGIGPAALQDALGGSDYRGSSYNNGDPARLTAGTKDVAHEFDCTWRTSDGTIARAWVFAPPVTRPQARQLAKASLRRGCAATHGAAFGKPSVATRCTTPKGVDDGYFGLFGDAWLSCTLGARKPEPADLTERTSRWCAAVVKAASGQTPEN